MNVAPPTRPRGRPVGGGISAEQAKDAFLDAAEQSLASRGYRASTMDVIARDAGYSRGSIYRHFPTRERLVEALVQRATQRNIARIVERQPPGTDPMSALVDSMVIVATELVDDPLIRNISDQTDERTVAHMLAHDAALTQLVEVGIEAMFAQDGGARFRPGVRPKDVAQFLIGTSMSMLLGVIPGTEDPAIARRYIEVFVLPALVADPPPPRAVFTESS
ncbi:MULTISPECIES: TetR/AcrR family transcriptional regulator [unclassified Mycobacterium]|uniref:TetR/AcrR family transcriptional regulator n=1 Tax=unclassified Mycobacterium TaxID=2642494 RepID=UPI0029C94702|nr:MULTISPECIES: TetR/AcrR family transcriptional regulator [unclassified Mycobacterium]